MKIRFYRFYRIIIILFLLFAALVWYLNSYFLPVKLKAIIVTKLEETLQKPVELNALLYRPLKGLSLTGLTVYRDESETDEKLLRIEEIRLSGLLLPPISRNGQMKAVVSADIKNMYLQVQEQEVLGDLRIYSSIVREIGEKKDFRYRGKAVLEAVTVKGLPVVEKVTGIRGNLSFSPDLITTDRLTGMVRELPFSLRGKVENFADPYLEAQVSSFIDENGLEKVLPDRIKPRLQNLQLAGRSSSTAEIRGKLKEPEQLEIAVTADFERISFSPAFLPTKFENITGELAFAKDGTLKAHFESPQINFRLNSRLVQGVLEVSELYAALGTLTCDLAGRVSNLAEPEFDLYGNLQGDTAELSSLFPAVKTLGMEGKSTASLFFKGKPGSWKDAHAGFKLDSDEIKLANCHLTELFLDGNLKDRSFTLRHGRTEFGGGTVDFTVDVEVGAEEMNHAGRVRVRKVSLEKVLADTKLSQEEISGVLNAECLFSGKTLQPESLAGRGWFEIGGGSLRKIPVLADMAEFLQLADKEKLAFKNAHATFVIEDNHVYTENLTLTDGYVQAIGDGYVTLDGQIALNCQLEFTQEVYESAPEVLRAIAYLNELGKYIMGLKVTGTVAAPQFEKVPRKPKEVIEDIGKKVIQNIFEGILEKLEE